MRAWTWFAVAIAVSPPLAAPAQMLELQPGVRVRVEAPGVLAGRLEALVSARSRDSLTLLPTGSAPFSIPLSAVTLAEVYRGRDRKAGAWSGAKWGALIGVPLAVLTVIGKDQAFNQIDPYCNADREVCAVYSDIEMGSIVALTSIGVGAGIGAIAGRTRWERLPVLRVAGAPAAALRYDPSPRTVNVGVRLSF